MKKIFLTILRSPIIDAVKSQTYLRGLIDKSMDERAHQLAYQESAGDEDFHMRMLEGYLVNAAETFATQVGDYLSTETIGRTGNNAITTDFSESSSVKYTLFVSDRFNESYTTSLARFVSKFIEHKMLVMWWTPINEKQSVVYEKFIENDLSDIKRCFNKVAPSAPVYPYTTKLQVDTSELSIEVPIGFRSLMPEEKRNLAVKLGYTIDELSIDDIEFAGRLRGLCHVEKVNEGELIIEPLGIGEGNLYLWSRHMEAETKISVKIRIREADE